MCLCVIVCVYAPEAGLISTGFTRLLQVPRFMNLCLYGVVTNGLLFEISHALSNRMPSVSGVSRFYRGKSPNMGRFSSMGKCIISYQEVLRSELKNVNH